MNDTISVLTLLMVLLAMGIASAKMQRYMIRLYQVQSILLALITFLTVLAAPKGKTLTMPLWRPNSLLMVIPITLAIIVPPLLARATIPLLTDKPTNSAVNPVHWKAWAKYLWYTLPRQARGYTINTMPPQQKMLSSLGAGLGLTVTAFIIAFGLPGAKNQFIDNTSLAVSIALLLLGLSTMIHQQNITAQIMGLLVMEHGMFLAAIKISAPQGSAPQGLVWVFVLSLFVYIMITLTILFYLLPKLHQTAGSMDVADQRELKG